MTVATSSIPVLETERLRLRAFAPPDALRVQQLAGDARVAETTASIPHPYPDGTAVKWFAAHGPSAANGTGVTWPIESKDDALVIGAISLLCAERHARGESGYWLGAAYWNRGYTTKAARRVIQHGFEHHRLHRIQSQAMLGNPGSWQVMEKSGMQREGILRGISNGARRSRTSSGTRCFPTIGLPSFPPQVDGDSRSFLSSTCLA